MESSLVIIYNKQKFKKIISKREIENRILKISNLLNNYYVLDNLIIICVLNGSVVVLSELLKNLKCNYLVDYIEVSSYKGKTKSSGKVELIQDINIKITNKKVLIIEDIVDTGTTLNFIYKKLLKMHPKDIKIFSLLYKKEKYKFETKIDWFGFEIKDLFTIGYGMDYDLKFRGLNDIYALS